MNRYEAYNGMIVEFGDSLAVGPEYRTEAYEIVKVNPKNVRIRGLATGRLINTHPSLIQRCDEPPALPPSAPVLKTVRDFVVGEAVVTRDPLKGERPDQVFIVVKIGTDRVNIVRLGGDRGKYWRVSPSNLEYVTLDWTVRP